MYAVISILLKNIEIGHAYLTFTLNPNKKLIENKKKSYSIHCALCSLSFSNAFGYVKNILDDLTWSQS
jgi:hypothetical protein